jgi:hypothetical protein
VLRAPFVNHGLVTCSRGSTTAQLPRAAPSYCHNARLRFCTLGEGALPSAAFKFTHSRGGSAQCRSKLSGAYVCTKSCICDCDGAAPRRGHARLQHWCTYVLVASRGDQPTRQGPQMAPRTRCSTSARVPCCLNMPRLVISVQHCAGEDGTDRCEVREQDKAGSPSGLQDDAAACQVSRVRSPSESSRCSRPSAAPSLSPGPSSSQTGPLGSGPGPQRGERNSRGHIVFKSRDSDPRAAGRAGLAPRRAPAWRRPNLRFQSTRTSSPWLPTSLRRPASSSASH